MPKKKGDHDGTPLEPAIEQPSKPGKKPKDPLDSAIEVAPGQLPPEKKKPK